MSNIQISDNPRREQYVATSSQTEFTIPFVFFSNSEITVWQNGVKINQGGSAGEYGVSGAGSPSGGLVTLVTGATASDVITIMGNLDIDRTSIYSATVSNISGADLNSDFNREVVMMQDLETTQDYLQLKYADWAEVSQDVTVTKDRQLPILTASQFWGKDSGDTAIVAYDLPTSGNIADGDAKYLVQTANASVPNAQVMGALASGLVVNTTTTGVQLTRTIVDDSSTITVTNGTGISGNPTVAISASYTGQTTITTVGTVSTGTWNATTIGVSYGGTGLSSYTLGDILYSSGTSTLTKLPGNTTTTQKFLSQTGDGINSAAPSWSTIPAASIVGEDLTKADDTNVTLTLGGTPTASMVKAVSLTLGWTGTLSVARGGTGAASHTAYSVICGGTTSTGALQSVSSVGTTGQVLTSNGAGAMPTWQDATIGGNVLPGNQYELGYYATDGTTISGFAMNEYSVLLSDTDGVPTSSAPLEDGEIIIGATGGVPSTGSITAGAGVTVTPGAGSITISAVGTSSGLAWYTVSGTTQTAAVNSGYILLNSSATTVTLPGTCAVGDVVAVEGYGAAGGWVIQAPAGQTIIVLDEVTSSGGTVTSTNQYNGIELICIVANTTWKSRWPSQSVTTA